MATKKQIELYNTVCAQLGQEPEEDFEWLSTLEASKQIMELIEIRDELEGRR